MRFQPRHLSPATSLQSSQVSEPGAVFPLASVLVPTSWDGWDRPPACEGRSEIIRAAGRQAGACPPKPWRRGAGRSLRSTPRLPQSYPSLVGLGRSFAGSPSKYWAMFVILIIAFAGIRSASAQSDRDWPLFRGNPSQTGVSQTRLSDNLDVLWTFQVEEGIEASATIVQGVVYVAGLNGKLYALSLSDGKVRWTYDAGIEIKSTPAIYAGILYFGDEDGYFHALKPQSGEEIWKFRAEAGVTSSANFIGDKVFFGSYDNSVYALNAKTGELLWNHLTGGYVHGTPVVIGETVAVTGCDGYLWMLRDRDGEVTRQVELGAYVAGSPAVANGQLFVGTFENEVLSIDLDKEELAWSYQHPKRHFPFYSSPAVTADQVFIGGRDKMLHALNAQTGEANWIHQARARIDASPVVVGNRVIAADKSGALLSLDTRSGEVKWSFEAGSPFDASPAVAQERLVIGTADGLVYCFGEKVS